MGPRRVLSLVGLGVLVARTAHDPPRMWAMVVFGLALIALYTTSTIYHSVPWRDAIRQRVQRLDHSMIFVLIAGTFTPLAVVVLDGGWRVGMLVGSLDGRRRRDLAQGDGAGDAPGMVGHADGAAGVGGADPARSVGAASRHRRWL